MNNETRSRPGDGAHLAVQGISVLLLQAVALLLLLRMGWLG